MGGRSECREGDTKVWTRPIRVIRQSPRGRVLEQVFAEYNGVAHPTQRTEDAHRQFDLVDSAGKVGDPVGGAFGTGAVLDDITGHINHIRIASISTVHDVAAAQPVERIVAVAPDQGVRCGIASQDVTRSVASQIEGHSVFVNVPFSTVLERV